MLVVLALVFGAIAGTAVHFALPCRPMRGIAVGPILGTVVGTGTWTGLTWAGIGPDNGWIWVATVLAPLAVTAAVLVLLSRARAAGDDRTRRDLGIA